MSSKYQTDNLNYLRVTLAPSASPKEYAKEYAKGYALEQRTEDVKSLMESTGFSLEKSLNALKIQGEERELIIEQLQQE